MRITSWNCLCRDVSRRLSDLAPLRSDLITLQECRRALGVPVFGGVGPPVAACATIAGRFVHLWPVREPRRTGGRCPATAAPGHAPGRWCADAGRPTRFKPSSPSPTDAVRDGSAKLGHPVQNVTREHGLTPLPR